MQAFQTVNFPALLDTLVSLTAAFVLGGLIGFERQNRKRAAGLRTNVPVALGCNSRGYGQPPDGTGGRDKGDCLCRVRHRLSGCGCDHAGGR